MSHWLEQLEENVRARKLFRDGQSILVAISGGLDSMVLLHALNALAKNRRWKLCVAHFNHKLRGRASDADEKFVRRAAASLGWPVKTGLADIKRIAQELGISIEMAARNLRHDFFASIAREQKIRTVALAHHADDQVELFFLRLLRGAGGEGLAGMNWASPSPSDADVQLIRPLLNFTKTDLCEFAEAEGISFREDATNAQLDFQRNRIRHELVPLLKKLQPALDETVLRTMEIVSSESSFVSGAARDWLTRKRPQPFDKLDVAVQRVCLRMQLRELGLAADFDLVEKLRLRPNCAAAIDPKSSVQRDLSGIISQKETKAFTFSRAIQRIDLIKQSETQFAALKISWTFENEEGASFQRKTNCEIFDADKIGSRIVLRHWRAGDRFQPIGASSPQKLQDIFTDLKIPRAERHRRILAATSAGEIFWVEGLRIGERFKLTSQTRRRLRWQWEKGE